MADGYKLYQKCPVCNGSGKRILYNTNGSSETDCNQCGGEGLIFFGWCTVDTFPMPVIKEDL